MLCQSQYVDVDDDPEVLRAIERDLRGHYAERYRVMRANSGSAALTTLRELKARNNPWRSSWPTSACRRWTE